MEIMGAIRQAGGGRRNVTTGIVSFIGVIGAGKDYRAGQLAEQEGAVRVDFKDALLDLASDIAGYDVRVNYDWFKGHVVGVRPGSNPLTSAFIDSEWKDIERRYPQIMTGRRLLTRLGTEGMRKRDENYWVNAFYSSAVQALALGKPVVNADCRFFNEIRAIKNIMSVEDSSETLVPSRFVFCNFKSARYNPRLEHASERLAQTLLGLGLEDGQEIDDAHFARAAEILGEKWE